MYRFESLKAGQMSHALLARALMTWPPRRYSVGKSGLHADTPPPEYFFTGDTGVAASLTHAAMVPAARCAG